MRGQYRVVSADSHLDIRPARWTHRVPAPYRDRAPRTVFLPDGREGMLVEGRPLRSPGPTTLTGIPYQQFGLQKMVYEGPGAGEPEQRVREQDQDGVDAEILFTHGGYNTLWRGISSDDAYRAVNWGYNEWLGKDYCAYAPDRLLAMGVIPDTGVDDAIKEMEHCAQLGLKGICLVKLPSGKSYPTPEDDRFWAQALAMNMPITLHTNGGNTRLAREGPSLPVARGKYRDERDLVGIMVRFVSEATFAPMQLILTGVFDRFPKLRIYIAETQAGWLPSALFQIDDNFERYRYWYERDFGIHPPAHPPSYYLQNNVLWGFMRDPVGVRLRHEIGVTTLLWGSDFAHAQGDWPNSRRIIAENFAGVPEDEKHLMLAGNAVEFFHLDVE